MTTTTIADIAREKVVLDDNEWFEGEDTTGSFKTRRQSIKGQGATSITTSAVSQDVGPNAQVVNITTSGSGLGTDVINVVNPTVDGNGWNSLSIGDRILLFVQHYTANNDAVKVTVNGQDFIQFYGSPPGLTVSGMNSLLLDFDGAAVALIWCGFNWAIDWGLTGSNYDGVSAEQSIQLHAGSGDAATSTPPGTVSIAGGQGDTGQGGGAAVVSAGNGDIIGGTVTITGGDGVNGPGGQVIVSAGNAGGSDPNPGGDYTVRAGNGKGAHGAGNAEMFGGGNNDSGGVGGIGMVSGGTGDRGGTGIVAGGDSNGAANKGGDVQIAPGNGPMGYGGVYVGPLPTADPHRIGYLWRDAAAGHVIKQSQG